MSTHAIDMVCVFDESLSLSAQHALSAYVSEHAQNNEICSQDLKSKFPYIDSIDIRTINSSTRVVSCRASYPIVSIQEDKVVTQSGYIVPSQVFVSAVVAGCKKLALAPYLVVRKRLDSSDVASLMRISPHMCSAFTVVWHRPTEIYCVDKKDPQCVVVVTDSVDPNTLMGNRAQQIMAQANISQSLFARCVDMRFENQFVVRQMDRGSYEKKIVC
jgi:hypothetical protein